MAFEELLNKEFGTKRWTTDVDDKTTLISNILLAQCALQATSGDPKFLGVGPFVSHVMYCRATEDIKNTDVVSIEGKDYKVVGVYDPTGTKHHLEIHLEAQEGT